MNITSSFSTNAELVLAKRYLIKDETGTPLETSAELFWRVAKVIAEADRRYGATDIEVQQLAHTFYDFMMSKRFMPNSPTIMNAGRPLGQLSACFVLPISDALSNGQDGIYDTLRSMALIHQSGGGTGFSFSRLRSNGSIVRSTTGVASGPVSFMRLYDASTQAVKQGGTRRGANMGILRVDHPDILEFIACKSDTTQITNFNISVAITDAFMAAVDARTDYDLIAPNTGKVVNRINAREVWNLLVTNAWSTGEPGLFFIDEANRYNPVPHIGDYEATNPCAEQPLLPYDTCNLGSINVSKYVGIEGFDWDALHNDVALAVRFLDNVIDCNKYPLPEIDLLARRIRRIGLGIMGFADTLILLGIPYDSMEAINFAQRLMYEVDTWAKQASFELAEERGAFPEWARSIWGPDATCARRDGRRIKQETLLRNCNVTTVAPTGTISIFAGCSSGIEPLFAVAFMRNQAGAFMPDVNEEFVRIAQREGWYSEALMRKVVATGSARHPEVPEHWQRVFVTANEISAEWHVRMQAIFQTYTDSAISKTINFSRHATWQEVEEAYLLAYRLGCKGITIYRDGSRDQQVLSVPSMTETITVPEGKIAIVTNVTYTTIANECPGCGGSLIEEGCIKCTSCGYEACEWTVAAKAA